MTAKVRASLDANPAAVERAIKVLYERQTTSEKATESTHVNNQVGVRHSHGHRIAYYGKWLARGNHLTGIHLEQARKLAHTYARTQLAELAAVKAGLVQTPG
jgi:hypothetical protein